MLERSASQVVEFDCDLESTAPDLARAFDSAALRMLRIAIACELAHAGTTEVFRTPNDLIDVELRESQGSACTRLVAEVDTHTGHVVVRAVVGARAQDLLSARLQSPGVQISKPRVVLHEHLESPEGFYAARAPGGSVARCFDAIAVDSRGTSARIVARDSAWRGFTLPPDLLEEALLLATWTIAQVDPRARAGDLRATRIARIHAIEPRPLVAVRIDLRQEAKSRASVDAFFLDAEGVTRIAVEGVTFDERASNERNWSELLRLARETLGFEPESPDSDLIAAGAQSLDLIRLLNAFERELGGIPNRESFFAHPSLTTLASTDRVAIHVEPLESGELTTAERQLWILEKEEDVDGAYNQQFALQILGNVSAAALQQALEQTVQTHAALRTTFPTIAGAPARDTHSDLAPEFRVIDGMRSSILESEQTVFEVLSREATRAFDLERGPLVRCVLARQWIGKHILMLVAHHLVVDEWSLGRVFLPELAARYAALTGASISEPTWGPIPSEAVDETPTNEVVSAEDLEWWRRTLHGVSDVLPWPTMRVRADRLGFRGRTYVAELSPAACARLSEVARATGVTQASAFLAVTQLLIARICNQERFCVGIFATNRDTAARESQIGYFVNLIPVVADLEGDASVEELLRAVHSHAMAALAHSGVPFARIVQAVKPSRVAAVQPLVQVVFAVDDLPSGIALGNEEATRVEIDTRRAKFDLTITLAPHAPGGRPCVRWEYRSDLFDAATIAHWAALFGRIVEQLGRVSSLRSLALLRSEDVEELTRGLNPPPTALPEASAITLIGRTAQRSPNAIAVAALGERLSYAQLWTQSAAVATSLHEHGVQHGDIVGVLLQRRVALPLAIIGVMRAGAVFLPLDPELPNEHLAWIVRRAGARVLLCDAESRAKISDCTSISIEDARQTLPKEVCEPRATDTAYVQFTSGSTGRPKGVCVSHKSLVNVLRSVAEKVAAVHPPAWLAITSAAFDISILELLLPLTVGGTVAMHPGLTSNCDFEPWITEPGARTQGSILGHVTHLQCTPSGLEAILNSRDGRRLLVQLKCLVVGGEAFPVSLAARARGATDARIWNAYGPTETTIWSSMHELHSDGPRVPIGRPLANTRCYVMDSSRALTPRGCCGELYIAGDGVASGYLNAPEETAARFLADPFVGDPVARMYKTGDIVRWNSLGELEFLGRNDDQIKIRGFRVEPAEIERAILATPGIVRCAVIPKVLNGRTLAVAFVVPEDADTDRLRADLAARLPHYMVPSAFVATRELPRTVNGKVDRKELVLRADNVGSDDERVEPRSELERVVLEVWREELRNPAIGVRDDFFQSGGDSLVALSVLSRLQRETGRALRLSMFTTLRTVENFANFLTASDGATRTVVHSGARRPFRSKDAMLDADRDGPVDAAAIATVPARALFEAIERTGTAHEPYWGATLVTGRGHIAMLFVPVLDLDVYRPESELLAKCDRALDYARKLGARAVSLTGLIPSATNYGAAFLGRDHGLHITTGHATTCAAICLNIEHALARTRRSMTRERLAFLGLGSIGLGTLRTLMRTGAAPQSILLCELSSNRARAESAREELANVWRYAGEIAVSLVDTNAGADLRHATLVVGATNLPGVLPVHLLNEGSIVVDDSAPHCFVSADALARMDERGDVLFTEAGAVRSASAVDLVVGLPGAASEEISRWIAESFGPDDREIMGCTLSALITATSREVVATTGVPDVEACVANRKWLSAAGFLPAPLRVGANQLSATFLERFAARFGHRL